MTQRLKHHLGYSLAVAAVLGLAACGNDQGQKDMNATLKASLGGLAGGKKKATPATTLPDVDAALANTTDPLGLLVKEDSNSSSFIIQIETNGPYRTFATPARQTVTFRQGMITSTRGLGNDLMSSDVDGSLALLRARKAGTATRVMRYLDGEDVTRDLTFTCTITTGGTKPVKVGAVNSSGREMTEACASDARSFTNTYLVDGKGEVLSSRQFLSPLGGTALVQVLRQ